MGMTAIAYEVSMETYREVLDNGLEHLDTENAASHDLDKAWHAISFLASGLSEQGFKLGGTTVGEGEGQFVLFTAEEVAGLCRSLEESKIESLLSKFDAGEFNEKEIYPGTWDSWSRDGYLKPALIEFSKFVHGANDRRNAIIVVIC